MDNGKQIHGDPNETEADIEAGHHGDFHNVAECSKERVDAFQSMIGPVIYYYEDSLQTIDANQDPAAVTAAVAAALKK